MPRERIFFVLLAAESFTELLYKCAVLNMNKLLVAKALYQGTNFYDDLEREDSAQKLLLNYINTETFFMFVER